MVGVTHDSRPQRTWYQRGNARILLVHAPITFGHSQLVLSFAQGRSADEPTRFQQAAGLIRKALSAFNRVLTVKTLQQFQELAVATATRGPYIKTLVLKASAQEDVRKEYKVHLVPFFESHDEACKRRYTAVHGVFGGADARSFATDKTGGLLGWLGERETRVDSWQAHCNSPFKEQLDTLAINTWRLHELASRLQKAWPK